MRIDRVHSPQYNLHTVQHTQFVWSVLLDGNFTDRAMSIRATFPKRLPKNTAWHCAYSNNDVTTANKNENSINPEDSLTVKGTWSICYNIYSFSKEQLVLK